MAAATKQQVAQTNSQTAAANQRVTTLLYNVTGENLGNDPKAWWNWWDWTDEQLGGAMSLFTSKRIADLHVYWQSKVLTR